MNRRTFGFAVALVFPVMAILAIPAFTAGNEDYKLTNKQHIEQRETVLTLAQNAAMYPYTLEIPSLGVHAGVRAMGVEKDGRMAVPNNYIEVGWYSLGTQPGKEGSAVMGAHVDNGSSINGIFKNLHTLQSGDSVYVTNAAGERMHFKVTHRKVYDRNEQVTGEVWRSSDGAHLNLITCHGAWISSENTYEKRIVIFTELVD